MIANQRALPEMDGEFSFSQLITAVNRRLAVGFQSIYSIYHQLEFLGGLELWNSSEEVRSLVGDLAEFSTI